MFNRIAQAFSIVTLMAILAINSGSIPVEKTVTQTVEDEKPMVFTYNAYKEARIPTIVEAAPKIEKNKEVIVEETSTEPDTEITEDQYFGLSEYEIDLLALVTMAEAEGECEQGQRLVIDTILNRVDSEYFPSTIYNVIYQKGHFECMWNGRINRCYVKEDIRKLVVEEMQSRTDNRVIFFRTCRYSDYGSPIFKVGNHYFSSYE